MKGFGAAVEKLGRCGASCGWVRAVVVQDGKSGLSLCNRGSLGLRCCCFCCTAAVAVPRIKNRD